MRLDRLGQPFLVIGENFHATRVLRRSGRHAVELPEVAVGILFDDAGERRVLPVHARAADAATRAIPLPRPYLARRPVRRLRRPSSICVLAPVSAVSGWA